MNKELRFINWYQEDLICIHINIALSIAKLCNKISKKKLELAIGRFFLVNGNIWLTAG